MHSSNKDLHGTVPGVAIFKDGGTGCEYLLSEKGALTTRWEKVKGAIQPKCETLPGQELK
jgi:hypothetical protein